MMNLVQENRSLAAKFVQVRFKGGGLGHGRIQADGFLERGLCLDPIGFALFRRRGMASTQAIGERRIIMMLPLLALP